MADIKNALVNINYDFLLNARLGVWAHSTAQKFVYFVKCWNICNVYHWKM